MYYLTLDYHIMINQAPYITTLPTGNYKKTAVMQFLNGIKNLPIKINAIRLLIYEFDFFVQKFKKQLILTMIIYSILSIPFLFSGLMYTLEVYMVIF